MNPSFPIIDGDGHVYEDDAQLMKYYEGPGAIRKKNSALALFPSLDGWQRGVLHERDDKNPNRPFHTDAGIWKRGLERFGFEGAVMYPTAGLGIGLMRDKVFATASATAYNNWLEDNYTTRDPRLYGVGLTPIMDPQAAAAEVRRCATQRTGFAAMVLPTVTCLPIKYGDEFFWPIFEEAERQNMPLALHGGPTGGFGLDFLSPFYMMHSLAHPIPLMIQLVSIVFGGVFDAFPRLRMVFLEAGASWVPFMMDRLDSEYDKIFSRTLRAKLKRRPREYLRDTDNFWVSCELEEQGLGYVIDAMGGSGRIIYSSDFPHEPTEDAIAAAIPEFLEDPRYDDTVKKNILHDNAADLYHITANGLDRRVRPARRGAGAEVPAG
jgi:predicted TIM-barrel fold metal-dependent hydrolase